MAHIGFNGISVHRFYTVSDAEPVPDSARCPLDPTEAVVIFQSHTLAGPLRVIGIRVIGKRLRGEKTKGTRNEGYYSVVRDVVKPDDRTGSPPAWVQQVVDRAVAEHAAGIGLAPVAVTA